MRDDEYEENDYLQAESNDALNKYLADQAGNEHVLKVVGARQAR